MNYLLITPVKNEENNLQKLANCIVEQTILPDVWIILNDNSTDKTQKIIEELEKKFPWIKSVILRESTVRNLDEHFGKIYNLAFGEAIGYCKKTKLPIEYLAKVDADIILPKNCIEKVLIKLDQDSEIGVASPNVKDLPNESLNHEKLDAANNSAKNLPWYDLLEPSDGLRIYRYATFKDIGGIPETMAPDAVALAKAKLKGWEIRRFQEIICYKTRKTSSSIQSIHEGYMLQGLRRYYLDYPLSIVVLFATMELFKGHPDLGMAILSGFMSGAINKKEKIIDAEVRDYYRNKRPKEIIKVILRDVS